MSTGTDRPTGWADRVTAWVVWHLPELLGVGVPGVVAVVWTRWAALVAVLVAVAWVVHEVRTAGRAPAGGAASGPRALRHGQGDGRDGDQVAYVSSADAAAGPAGAAAGLDGGRAVGGGAA